MRTSLTLLTLSALLTASAMAGLRAGAAKVVISPPIGAGMAGLLRPLLGPGISMDLEVPSVCPRIRIDPTQLEQVVLNLVINARDAMPSGGRIRVALPERTAASAGSLELTVSDTGEGMPPEVQARIFEPFFTTKASGKGTGLGLATVHGIVHQAGGTITVDSAIGVGTTFRVHFPLTPAPASPLRDAPRTP